MHPTITQVLLVLALVAIGVLMTLMTIRLVRLSPRHQWRRSTSAHEVGHALVAWFACRTTVLVRYIGSEEQGFSCCYVNKTGQYSALELWHRLAFTLAGVAAGISTLGRIENPTNCREDLIEALCEARALIGLGLPEIEQVRREVSTTVNPPNWARISREHRPTVAQAEVLDLGLRLAVTIIVRHHDAFKRARTLAARRFGRAVILTRTDLAMCFGDKTTA